VLTLTAVIFVTEHYNISLFGVA